MGSVVKKVMFVGRATVFMVGLAVILALTVGVAGAAFGANGTNFILGQTNAATAITKLAGAAGVSGPSLQIDNNSANAAATALDLQVEAGRPPMTVNSGVKVANLNADRLDDREASSFANGVNGKATDADKLDGKDASDFFSGGTYVVLRSAIVGANDDALLVASCDPGDVVLSGGFISVDFVRVENSARNTTGSWGVFAVNPTSASDNVTAEAVCADFGAPHQT